MPTDVKEYRPVGGSWVNQSWTTGVDNEVIPVTFDLPADVTTIKYSFKVRQGMMSKILLFQL